MDEQHLFGVVRHLALPETAVHVGNGSKDVAGSESPHQHFAKIDRHEMCDLFAMMINGAADDRPRRYVLSAIFMKSNFRIRKSDDNMIAYNLIAAGVAHFAGFKQRSVAATFMSDSAFSQRLPAIFVSSDSRPSPFQQFLAARFQGGFLYDFSTMPKHRVLRYCANKIIEDHLFTGTLDVIHLVPIPFKPAIMELPEHNRVGQQLPFFH